MPPLARLLVLSLSSCRGEEEMKLMFSQVFWIRKELLWLVGGKQRGDGGNTPSVSDANASRQDAARGGSGCREC